MHILTCRARERHLTWRFGDGLFDLSPDLPGGPLAVVAIDDHAVLLAPNCRQTLSASRPTRLQELELCWQPAGRSGRPTALTPEPTQRARRGGPRPPLHLVTPEGEEVELDRTLTIIGRHHLCDLRLDDPRVSAVHCIMRQTPRGVRVVDLDSKNGTVVDGARISSVLLRRGANLELGGARLQVRAEAGANRQIPLHSRAMRDLERLASRVAATNAAVLIEGESGVGKEGMARQLHQRSGRSGLFVPINAAALSPTLAASELFGHVRGAFTGAEQTRDGAFHAANQGTLFLDEVAELPLSTQAELLRVLEERRVRRVGDHTEVPIDTRLISATNRDLASRVRAGAFRADLFHRICVLPVRIPALRERPTDLEHLATHFAEQAGWKLSPAALERLRRYPWPGNIRELANVIRRAAVTAEGLTLEASDLQFATDAPCSPRQLDRLVHETVIHAYHANQGSVAATARELGIHRSTVYRHLRAESGQQTQ